MINYVFYHTNPCLGARGRLLKPGTSSSIQQTSQYGINITSPKQYSSSKHYSITSTRYPFVPEYANPLNLKSNPEKP
jgi:hypothetical protein